MAEKECVMPSLQSQYRHKIDELAELVHPRDNHPKIFAMIEAYLDESGIHEGATTCVIGGYFAEQAACRELEKRWLRTLNYFRVPLEKFHAKDLLRKVRGGDTEAVNILESLVALVKKSRHVHPVSAAVVVPDFESLSLPQRKFLTGAKIRNGKLVTDGCASKPYFLPFQHCIKTVVSYAPQGGKVHFFFGLDRSFSNYANLLYKQIALDPGAESSLGNTGFPLAGETPQLQVADLLVHMMYLKYPEVVKAIHEGKTIRQMDAVTKAIFDMMRNSKSPQDHKWQDRELMENHLARVPERERLAAGI